MNESESVRNRPELRRARDFPVDRALHRSGNHFMEAHIKLDNGEMAPRLYFLYDTRGETGKVHVGYVGPHLPTKLFN